MMENEWQIYRLFKLQTIYLLSARDEINYLQRKVINIGLKINPIYTNSSGVIPNLPYHSKNSIYSGRETDFTCQTPL
jgi:hypothetical protein